MTICLDCLMVASQLVCCLLVLEKVGAACHALRLACLCPCLSYMRNSTTADSLLVYKSTFMHFHNDHPILAFSSFHSWSRFQSRERERERGNDHVSVSL